jgi:catechol 2,3-dioxygenase-like lactoylglutathione lyase family enzyme
MGRSPVAPTLSGLHHLTFPVSNLDTSIAWYQAALGASRVDRFDHHDKDGALFAVIVELPGLDTVVQLRRAPEMARAVAGYNPVTFAVADRQALDQWVAHLDRCGVAHSQVTAQRIGEAVDFASPDDLALRLYTDPVGGIQSVQFEE